MLDITFDIEANNLLNSETIDYTASPYVLKDTFKMHSIVVEEHGTGNIVAFYDGPTYIFDGQPFNEVIEGITYTLDNYEPLVHEHKQLAEFKQYILTNTIQKVVTQNGINFDFLVLKLAAGMDYEVEPDTWCGKKVIFEDTMITAKTLNPDRFGGASLENLAKLAGKAQKMQFRKHIHESLRFKHFAADMLYYNIFDVKATTSVFHYLEKEKGDWDWKPAIRLEKAVAEIITRQEHRGFKFDKELAEDCIAELDTLMEERRVRVEPLLPPRPATKKFLKEHTPPANQLTKTEIVFPKAPFLQNGEFSAVMVKMADKMEAILTLDAPCNGYLTVNGNKIKVVSGGIIESKTEVSSYMQNFIAKHDGDIHPTGSKVRLYGKVYTLPMPLEPIKTEMVATINDTTHIKNWLVGLGWSPTEYKEKDITVKSGTAKLKRTPEELAKAIADYVEETVNSNLCGDRMAHFDVHTNNKIMFQRRLASQASKRGCKVLTNPSFTVGQEKEIDPALLKIANQFPYVKDIVEYLTYRHRRNSILGGGLDWDDEEEAEKGFLSNYREDGRIPTPADTCGTATSRMSHKSVANIPRYSSLYGDKMRALFGVDHTKFLQVGYDFSSLEAMMEAHYCWAYDNENKDYCKSLLLEKPNDTHSKMAQRVTELLNREFGRTPAKSVRYGCSYGAQPPKVAKTIGCSLSEGEIIFNAFWDLAWPLKKLKEALLTHWKDNGKKFIKGIDGRKVPTRAEHALINSLFQSAGVICAKYTMVVHDRLLKAEGLAVDFFRDNWKLKQFCQQLIAYHK